MCKISLTIKTYFIVQTQTILKQAAWQKERKRIRNKGQFTPRTIIAMITIIYLYKEALKNDSVWLFGGMTLRSKLLADKYPWNRCPEITLLSFFRDLNNVSNGSNLIPKTEIKRRRAQYELKHLSNSIYVSELCCPH